MTRTWPMHWWDSSSPRPLQGERSRTAKLTNDDVYAIRDWYDSAPRTAGGRVLGIRSQAYQFGVSVTVVRRIGKRQAWRHLPERDE